MKTIKISPEWVLDKSAILYHVNGIGRITILPNSITDSRWIDLALQSLGVKYKPSLIGYDPDPETQYFEKQWEFNIEAECPSFHLRMNEMNNKNLLLKKSLKKNNYEKFQN